MSRRTLHTKARLHTSAPGLHTNSPTSFHIGKPEATNISVLQPTLALHTRIAAGDAIPDFAADPRSGDSFCIAQFCRALPGSGPLFRRLR
jgi:hypothetical protein